MEASTTIRKMLLGNKIFVPSYQRAYSWETPSEQITIKTQTDVFLTDLEEYKKSNSQSPYYFGHFLFEDKSGNSYNIIDGQQRLTTIVIFLSALFAKLKSMRKLTEDEQECYEDIVKRNATVRFSTVDYDNQLFKDYVIEQTKKDKKSLETESAKRIVNAFDFFTKQIIKKDKDEVYLKKMINTISEASCSTHIVKNESEAIQMFIFQNNRGKKPSNLEVIKAQFMFNVNLYGGDDKDSLINEIKNRFEKIYKSISSIEYKIDEDDILLYTMRVYFNSLWESNAIDKINELLAKENPIPFIKEFTYSLALSFEHLTSFFTTDEKSNIEIHSLVTLGGIGISIPFVIKSYRFGLKTSEICQLCTSLESLVLRHRLIGTRADLTTRINEVYSKFTYDNTSIQPIVERINYLKTTTDWWWAYWNNDELQSSIQGGLNRTTAKYLLWKYENHLESQGKEGYKASRFDKIIKPELEHIAPQTPTNNEPIASGYCQYDEEFKNEYLDCLGNYLLISKSHNCSVGNKPFREKYESYTHLAQQREIQEMVEPKIKWTKKEIKQRKNKIIDFIINNL